MYHFSLDTDVNVSSNGPVSFNLTLLKQFKRNKQRLEMLFLNYSYTVSTAIITPDNVGNPDTNFNNFKLKNFLT